MRIGEIEVKRRVWVGLLFAVAVICLWWIWSRGKIPAVAVRQSPPGQPLVRLARPGAGISEKVLRERAEYFDPTPLFFPTEWNFGQGGLHENLKRQPGQVFGNFEDKFGESEQDLKPATAPLTAIPTLADVVTSGNEAPFGGFGESDFKFSSLPERGGFLEIRSLRDGKIILTQTLGEILVSHADFAPLEFLAVVSSAGMVGEPVLTAGSGREEVDAVIRTYLVKSFRLGERVDPGIYRISIGP